MKKDQMQTTQLMAANERLRAEIGERKRVEERVRRLLRQQTIVNKLSLALGETLNLEQLYGIIYKHVLDLMDADPFIVSFYDGETELIEAAYIIDEGVEQDVSILPPIPLEDEGQGTQSIVIRTGKPLYFPDFLQALAENKTEYYVEDDDTIVAGKIENTESPPHSAIMVPMKMSGKTIGVIQVHSLREDAYTQDDIILLAALANVAAVALQNARLYEEAQQQARERLQLAEQVQAQARQVQQILATVPEGVFWLDENGRILLANPSAQQHLAFLAGVGEGDLLAQIGGQPLTAVLTSPPQGLWHEVEKDGRIFGIIARPIVSGTQSDEWVFVVRELTREREIQQRYEQQGRLASVGQLAAGIAHDFNNIMAVIVLYAQLIMAAKDLPAQMQERLQTIFQQAMRASELTQRILDFSRRSVLTKQHLDLVPFLKELVKMLERLLPDNIEIDMEYGGECWVDADVTRLQQVLVNLAVNARDAMPDGGRLTIRLRYLQVEDGRSLPLPEMEPGDWIHLSVADTGTGIDSEQLPHLFDPFFTTKEPGKGTGLGLAQAYGIVKQHGGFIAVESELGAGACFDIYLPALLRSEKNYRSGQVGEAVQGEGQLILLVEDDPITRAVLAESLQALNYRVLEAENGRLAVDHYRSRRGEIALILSDLVMPEMSGMAMLQVLREYGQPKVIFLTGHPLNMQDEDENLVEGPVLWLQKPPRLEDLGQSIAKLLADE